MLLLPPIQKYVCDNDVSIEAIQYERVNEDLTSVNNNHVTECELQDRIVNSQVNNCFAMPSNQNKMEKERVKVTENRIEEKSHENGKRKSYIHGRKSN